MQHHCMKSRVKNRMKNWTAGVWALALVAFAPTCFADPGVGIAFTFVPQSGMGVGLRVFSDRKQHDVVASAGVDWLFDGPRAHNWRASVGLDYLVSHGFAGVNLGFTQGVLDGGASIGLADTGKH